MQNPHEEHQKVLASFLSTIARDGGWWYRIPKGTASDANKEDVIPQDAIMPHFGTLFGLSEAATQIILHEMGLLNYDQNNQRYSVRHNGWEDLASMFQVKHLIELESTKFNGLYHSQRLFGTLELSRRCREVQVALQTPYCINHEGQEAPGNWEIIYIERQKHKNAAMWQCKKVKQVRTYHALSCFPFS